MVLLQLAEPEDSGEEGALEGVVGNDPGAGPTRVVDDPRSPEVGSSEEAGEGLTMSDKGTTSVYRTDTRNPVRTSGTDTSYDFLLLRLRPAGTF